MDLTKVEKQRSGLQQYLVSLIIVLLGLIMYFTVGKVEGYVIPTLVIVSLLACLYILARERKLKRLETILVRDLIAKDRSLDRLGRELKGERYELEEEKGKAADLQERLTEIAALYRAINKVNTEARNSQVATTALRAALDLIGGERGSVMLLDEKKEYLFVASAIGIPEEVVSTIRQPVGSGVAGWVVQYGEPTILDGDARGDSRFRDATVMTESIQSSMCVPLKLRSEPIGVLNLAAIGEQEKFTEYHMRLATIFGEHASIAIMYSRLLRSLNRTKANNG